MTQHAPHFAVPLRYLDLLRLQEALATLGALAVPEVYLEFSDGRFSSAFGFGNAMLAALQRSTSLSRHVHLLAEDAEKHAVSVAENGADVVTVPVETCVHANRVLTHIRAAGASPGIAINPSTPLSRLDYLLPSVDRVLLVTGEDGAESGKLMSLAYERLRILADNIRYHRHPVLIQVTGMETAEEVARCLALGAGSVVLGRNALVPDADSLQGALERFLAQMRRAAVTV